MKQAGIEARMGTWGVVLKPNKRANVVFEQPFHLKMAVLDFNGFVKEDSHFRVILTDNADQIACPLTICMLSKPNRIQTTLDLHFEIGDDITFLVKAVDTHQADVNGFSVHLSGTTDRFPEAFITTDRQNCRITNDEIKVEKPRSSSNPFVGSERKIDVVSGSDQLEIPGKIPSASAPTTPFDKTPSIVIEPTNSVDKRTENWVENSGKGKKGLMSNSEKLVDLCRRRWKNLSTSSAC